MKPLRSRLERTRKESGMGWAILERDYLLSWILAAIGRHETLRETLVFKGGTALKKCYYDIWRILNAYRNSLELKGFASLLKNKCQARNVNFQVANDFFKETTIQVGFVPDFKVPGPHFINAVAIYTVLGKGPDKIIPHLIGMLARRNLALAPELGLAVFSSDRRGKEAQIRFLARLYREDKVVFAALQKDGNLNPCGENEFVRLDSRDILCSQHNLIFDAGRIIPSRYKTDVLSFWP